MRLPLPRAFMLATQVAAPLNADTIHDEPDAQTDQPAFTTTQSLLTFSGSSAVAAALWKLIANVVDAQWADERWVPAAICAAIGLYLILKGLETASGVADKYGVLLVGVLNSAFLWAAVIGVDVGLDATGVASSTAGAP